MVGDRRHDVEGAQANGIPCIGVLWGIGDRAELDAAGADAVIGSPRDLPASLYRLMSAS
jgi:phosphoglycolate phosphatase